MTTAVTNKDSEAKPGWKMSVMSYAAIADIRLTFFAFISPPQ